MPDSQMMSCMFMLCIKIGSSKFEQKSVIELLGVIANEPSAKPIARSLSEANRYYSGHLIIPIKTTNLDTTFSGPQLRWAMVLRSALVVLASHHTTQTQRKQSNIPSNLDTSLLPPNQPEQPRSTCQTSPLDHVRGVPKYSLAGDPNART
jgi:predicted XRE-type DNA-binding protein